MRFIGNKELITSEISDLLRKKGLLQKKLKFFDAFCGTGAVSNSLKTSFDIIVNDLLNWCVVYTRGRISGKDCRFKKLGFDPSYYFNNNDEKLSGFFFQNYSPGGSNRKYFSSENAARIDYFRAKIEEWKKRSLITDNEYCYLLSCLIESVSLVSNTAGVYGAFLKHWDPRANKPIKFIKINIKNAEHNSVKFFNEKIEDIISEVECDILYIDPPYTQNQYGTQYHLLETLVSNDNPSISPITGSRSTAPMRSDWSKDYKAHILFDRILAKTKAKYILFSYSIDGFMSKDFITASMNRYGKQESYLYRKIDYKKYRNFKNRSSKGHCEYLFFIEKKDNSKVCYESPLNYIGSKSKMISEIKRNLPGKIGSFIDAFGGGFNVGVNVKSKEIIYNDVNHFVKDLVESFKINDTYDYLLYIRRITKKFGLEKSKSSSYLKVRKYYNSLPQEKRNPKLLYTIILYGFQQQIRFNGEHNFNNPVGMRWFNDRVLEKMISFSRIVKESNFKFMSCDLFELKNKIPENAFVYMDPPYTFTRGSYNDGKRGFLGWSKESERALLDFADKLDANGNRFMISYIIKHGGKVNGQVGPWIKRRGYRLIELPPIPSIRRSEVLIVNYEP